MTESEAIAHLRLMNYSEQEIERRMFIRRWHERAAKMGLIPVGQDGEPIDRMSQLRESDRLALASYERSMEP